MRTNRKFLGYCEICKKVYVQSIVIAILMEITLQLQIVHHIFVKSVMRKSIMKK